MLFIDRRKGDFKTLQEPCSNQRLTAAFCILVQVCADKNMVEISNVNIFAMFKNESIVRNLIIASSLMHVSCICANARNEKFVTVICRIVRCCDNASRTIHRIGAILRLFLAFAG